MHLLRLHLTIVPKAQTNYDANLHPNFVRTNSMPHIAKKVWNLFVTLLQNLQRYDNLMVITSSNIEGSI